MSVQAISTYEAEPKDKLENFNGMQLVYLYWPKHLMFCAPFTFLVPPDISFAGFLSEMVQPAIAAHPDAEGADLINAQWQLNGDDFTPEANQIFAALGIDHKSLLTMNVTGNVGIQDSAL